MLCKRCNLNEVPPYRIKQCTYLCRECHKIVYPPNKEKNRERVKRYHKKFRDCLFEHYGRACVFCGATEDLQFDHVKGAELDKSKKNNGRSAWNQLKWFKELIAANFPPTCQVLCKRCNFAKCRMTNDAFLKMVKDVYCHQEKIMNQTLDFR